MDKEDTLNIIHTDLQAWWHDVTAEVADVVAAPGEGLLDISLAQGHHRQLGFSGQIEGLLQAPDHEEMAPRLEECGDIQQGLIKAWPVGAHGLQAESGDQGVCWPAQQRTQWVGLVDINGKDLLELSLQLLFFLLPWFPVVMERKRRKQEGEGNTSLFHRWRLHKVTLMSPQSTWSFNFYLFRAQS